MFDLKKKSANHLAKMCWSVLTLHVKDFSQVSPESSSYVAVFNCEVQESYMTAVCQTILIGVSTYLHFINCKKNIHHLSMLIIPCATKNVFMSHRSLLGWCLQNSRLQNSKACATVTAPRYLICQCEAHKALTCIAKENLLGESQ